MKNDFMILEEVKGGNIDAFSELVLRHKKVILRMALRMTRDLELAEDIVQDSFLKAFRKIHLFENRSSFKSWLFQIAINTAKNKIRSLRMNHVNIDNVSISIAPKGETDLHESDLRGALRLEIDRLPPKQKMALELRVFEELSFKEISEIMECPYDTAKANYRHALMKLRSRFASEEDLQAYSDGPMNFIGSEANKLVSEVD